MREYVLSKISLGSFIKLCFFISVHVGTILALIFFVTNHGRRVNFGTFYFTGFKADIIGLAFLFISISIFFGILGILSIVSINFLLKRMKGIKIRAALQKP